VSVPVPESGQSLEIHLVAIGGTGMAPLACLLKALGHRVRGSDGPLYPPMSTLLAEAGIEPMVGYEAAHLEPRPDLVIIGNAVPRHNPEAAAARDLDLPQLSMPQALGRFLLEGRRPLVVAGTHGKTTTTTIASWVYTSAGADPGYLIGGLPKNLEQSFRVGGGERFIIEGDEYNASYFDRGPKFLHYRPNTLILTSAEYDHADLYPSPQSLRAAYARLIALLPSDGLLVACGETPEVRELAAEAPCEVVLYGLGENNDLHPRNLEATAEGSRFLLEGREGEVEIHLAVPGEHNLLNALAVFAAARHDALPNEAVARALASFAGVQRRLEVLGTARGITVVDDFAHHPTAVEKSLGGLRQAYPGRRLVILFEPRSLTAGRAMFQDAYLQAFKEADVVLFAPVFHAERLGEGERLDLPALCRALGERGVDARVCESVDAVRGAALELAVEGDVLATMSSGAFGGMPHRLLEALSGG
jgi:UDP-N-acetylmuramate: L-alanyl-gamma-D-glutamyl-meso-diaminopimelate ligase